MDYLIDDSLNGKTVLKFMSCTLGLSRATIKHLKFKPCGIEVNGSHVTVRHVLSRGEVLSLAIEDTQAPEKLSPCDLDIDIAYEDDEVVVPNKPADMPTHQSFGHYKDTVANALAYRYASRGIPFVFRPVNRLDRNTSGLLLIARDRVSAASLSAAMREHKISKRYVAILHGVPKNDRGTIDTYMRRTAKSVIVREICGEGEGGDRAITEYEVICKSETHTLVAATPITGRTHQLRVHFASIGCPIEGDDMYGEASELISRHALHSFSLSFPRPSDGSTLTVTAPLPDDMRILAERVLSNALDTVSKDIKNIILPTQEENI
ncbi:MAG: RluA family pseudouridine synthase [Ruminococcaceae bacterium]|nr:RluA family pseudouridine synthase [Oscillospiraceae bacterium]